MYRATTSGNISPLGIGWPFRQRPTETPGHTAQTHYGPHRRPFRLGTPYAWRTPDLVPDAWAFGSQRHTARWHTEKIPAPRKIICDHPLSPQTSSTRL